MKLDRAGEIFDKFGQDGIDVVDDAQCVGSRLRLDAEDDGRQVDVGR